MQQAIELAKQGAWTVTPNPKVGCVIVKDKKILGTGFHKQAGKDHAEIVALKQAKNDRQDVTGATMYVNLEPCSHTGRTPPCVDAIKKEKIAKVIVAHEDPYTDVAGSGISALKKAGIDCEVGLLEHKARWLNRGFIRRCETNRPWVILKLASSMDGRIALANSESKWITSEASRLDVHKLRAVSCAIMTSPNTAINDNPRLTARDVNATRQPLRVLVDSNGRCPPDLKLFADGAVVVTATKSKQKYNNKTTVVELPDTNGKVDVAKVLEYLASEFEINYLLVEAGSIFAGHMLQAQLVDEIIAYIAPKFLGDGPANAYFEGLTKLNQDNEFKIRKIKQIGPDCRLQLVRN